LTIEQMATSDPSVLRVLIGPEDHYLGPADAPIVLVQYGDYECPESARAHAAMLIVVTELGEDVRFIFRNFPRGDVHPNAQMAAEAAESVAAHGGNDAFWDMHDLLFLNQDALEPDDLIEYASAVGVDRTVVAQDLATGALTARVRADVDGAIASGVNETPAFFVNGRRFDANWADAVAFATALRAAARRPLTA
jgi:protein-disulfide isomerase